MQDWEKLARQADFRAAAMAALCSVSARHLRRVFQRQYQMAPSEWLRKLQCELAKELILKGQINKAVAAELGFGSETHFCREFKKVFGASPQTFAPKSADQNQNVRNGQ